MDAMPGIFSTPERFDDARLALQKLEELVGVDDPDVVAAKTTLELEELLS